MAKKKIMKRKEIVWTQTEGEQRERVYHSKGGRGQRENKKWLLISNKGLKVLKNVGN